MLPPLHDRRKTGTMERHLQTVILTVLTAAIIGLVNLVLQLRDNSAVLITEVAALKEQIIATNARFDQYLPRSEAEARFGREDDKHSAIDQRLDSLEGKRTR